MPTRTVYEKLSYKLKDVVPDFELRQKAELAEEILRLKRERNAVILGHNYMEPALFHSVPDFTGDSLELCRRAAETDKERIVFCGVRFMAETAKLLNPDKVVLLPSKIGGCSLASSITAEDVRGLKARYPGTPVVAYVNTYAEVKAEVDLCCTSSNAAEVVQSTGRGTVIFIPDEYLARNVARETGREFVLAGEDREPDGNAPHPGGRIIGWPGRCEVHEKFAVDDIDNARMQFPGVLVLAHPECSPEVVRAADFSGSTSAMIRRVQSSSARNYLLLTECSMGDNITAENPEKEMVRVCSVRCPHMNEITLEDTLAALEQDRHLIEVPQEIHAPATRSIERMLAVS